MSDTSTSGSAGDDLPDALDGLSPTCTLVFKTLRHEGPRLSRQELLRRTGLSESALDVALSNLVSRHLVLKSRESDDPTQVVAELRDYRGL